MSQLDRAFLKAYRKGEAGAVVAANQTTATPTAPVMSPTRAMHGPIGYQPIPGPPPMAHRTIPSPHIRMPSPAAAPALQTAPLQPAFEVLHFAWPVIVQQLSSLLVNDLTALAGLAAARHRAGRNTLLLSSCRRGEGRSTITLAVARALARYPLRVAMVDADFTRPQLASMLDLSVSTGWEDVLGSEQSLSEALIESPSERLTLLPLRAPLSEPASLQGNARLSDTFEQLRRQVDVVLVDAGPIDSDAGAIEFAAALSGARIDDALAIRDPQRTTSEELRQLGRRLSAAGICHWDVIENFVPR